MTEIIADYPRFASPHSTLSRILRDRAILAARAFQAQVRRFELGLEEEEEEEYAFLDDIYYTYTTIEEQDAHEQWRDREENARGHDIQWGHEILRARAAARPSPARRIRTHRIRARRSPASTRRATADSGGDDGDGGDPEPPRSSNLPAYRGGAL